MENNKNRLVLILLTFYIILCMCIIFLIKGMFTPFMISDGSFITKKKVKEFDLSYTLGDANNFGVIDDIYLIDINLKNEPSVVLYEEIYDNSTNTSPLKEIDFQKIAPFVWRIKNPPNGFFRILAYERGSERYYFIYKCT